MLLANQQLAFAQQKLASIAKKSTAFTTDNQGNVYVACADNTVYRYNSKGDSTGFFSSKRRGTITHIDATNPLSILLYHQDIPMITALNGMMGEKFTVDLRKNNIYLCPSIAYSADGDIWIYNALDAVVQKIASSNTEQSDPRQKQKYTSFGFQQLFSEQVQPIFLTEQERQLFVVDSSIGVIMFDQFGNYINTYHLKCSSMQYINGSIVYFANGKLNSYNLKTIASKEAEVADVATALDVRVAPGLVFVRRENAIDIYRGQD
jgi:hypothetical protein